MKIVAISDTHGFHEQLDVPDGDVLVVAGDFTRHGKMADVVDFGKWMAKLPHKHKLVVAGNHDFALDKKNPMPAIEALVDAIYLEDAEWVVDGVKFYGSPWTPAFQNWAFMKPRRSEELARVWAKIPRDTNVLITHGAPYGVLDEARGYGRIGDETLERRVADMDIRAHIFGHVHEGFGNIGAFYNVAICNEEYKPVNAPTVIDI